MKRILLAAVILATGCSKTQVSTPTSATSHLEPAKATPAATQGKPAISEEADLKAFEALVKKNAQKPGNLQIVEFGKAIPAKTKNTEYHRSVIFRCDLIEPNVYKDTAVVYYAATGKITAAHLAWESKCWWHP